jgi:hypothetical protein
MGSAVTIYLDVRKDAKGEAMHTPAGRARRGGLTLSPKHQTLDPKP